MAMRRYCTSLVVYERVRACRSGEDSEWIYVPYAYCLVSDRNCLQAQNQVMLTLYRGFLDTKLVITMFYY